MAKIGQKVSSSAISRHSRMSDRSRKPYDCSEKSSKHPSFLLKGRGQPLRKKRGQTRYSRVSSDMKQTR